MSRIRRLRIQIQGTVQGVGFRPFVYKLAHELGLKGWVLNSAAGVTLEIEGRSERIDTFLARLAKEKPTHCLIQSLQSTDIPTLGDSSFIIRTSDQSGDKQTLVLPDLATCPECLEEINSPQNRRYQYPFTNCTQCGPRYSIIESLPYDRPNTTMSGFEMCPDCQEEYDKPEDRRFHAQPNACPTCGPQLALWDRDGNSIATGIDAIEKVVGRLQDGQVVAIKGLGGFHLAVDASNEEAIKTLRQRKNREEKPFAIMCRSLVQVQSICDLDDVEIEMLTSSAAPIVLLRQKDGPKTAIAENVAPGNP